MPLSARRSRALLALGLGLAAALGCAELALRRVLDLHAYRVWRPGLETVFRPSPGVMSGISGPSLFRISSLGFRAEERPPAPELSLLALGGSTTECLYLDQREAWPALLEARLAAATGRRLWVANAGRSGRTTRDHVVQVRHLLSQPPRFDLVLLLTGVNDLTFWLAWWADPSEPEAAGPRRLHNAFEVLPLAAEPGAPWKRTALWRLLESAHERFLGPARVQDEAAAVYELWRAHRRGASAWIDELPDPAGALADFRRQLGAIDEHCRRASARLVLVTQPALWSAGLAPELEERLWMGGVGLYQERAGCRYYTSAALARGLALYNQTLRSFALERGLPCLDLGAALGPDPRFFYDDVHFNEEGARVAAEFLARESLALGLFE